MARSQFFTPDEYGNADHQVRGRFDEYGRFQGSVSIYGEPVDGHVINWRSRRGLPTECGPFKITFAAIEGRATYSTLPWKDHSRIIQKTEKIGGLYLYRDGIRILPYGDTDYDWLGIEFRRTKSARYYYFSHRKMFGVVEIDSTNETGPFRYRSAFRNQHPSVREECHEIPHQLRPQPTTTGIRVTLRYA